MEDYIYVGKIVNTHGIKGEIRILSDFDYKDKVFVPGVKIYLGRKKEEMRIVTYRHHKNFEMVTLAGYNDINQVLQFKGLYVYIDRKDLVLDDNQILDSDLISLKVIVDGNEIGYISDVRNVSYNNKLLEINFNNKTYLIPYQKEFVSEIDLANKKIVITPIKGMFE